jgi:glycosyltransferase involved in cell wall biosynthesis
VRVIRHARNRGTTAAKNTGLDALRGPFGGILDSDDTLLPDAIAKLMTVFERQEPPVGMVFANCVDPSTGEWTGKGLSASSDVTFRDAVTGRFRGEFWGIWRTSAIGTRRFDPDLPGGSESLVWHDVYRTTRVYYLHDVVRLYSRGSPDSVSTSNLEPRRLERTRLMYERYLERFGADIRRFDSHAYARQLQTIGFWHLLSGERLAAGRCCRSGFCTRR